MKVCAIMRSQESLRKTGAISRGIELTDIASYYSFLANLDAVSYCAIIFIE
jgi:hypothetical protein